MNYALQPAGAQGISPVPAPQPTDMQTHVQRAQEVGGRFNVVADQLTALIGRLYGEGSVAKEGAPTPRPAGLSSELTSAISTLEALADRLGAAADRLEQLA